MFILKIIYGFFQYFDSMFIRFGFQTQYYFVHLDDIYFFFVFRDLLLLSTWFDFFKTFSNTFAEAEGQFLVESFSETSFSINKISIKKIT